MCDDIFCCNPLSLKNHGLISPSFFLNLSSVLCMKKVLTLVLLLEHKNPKELKLVAPPRRSSRVHENNEKKFLTLLLVLIVKPRSSNPPLFVSSESLRHDVPKMCGLEKIKKRSTCIQSHSWKGPSSR